MHDLSLQILEFSYGLAYHLLYNIPCACLKGAFLHWSMDSYIHVIWAIGVYGTVKESNVKIWL